MTIEKNLDKYCQTAIDRGASHALVIHTSRIVTAPWVRLKCQFGCSFYGKSYCCPPHTPAPKQTCQLLDSYNRAILLHLQWTKDQQSGREIARYYENVVSMETEMFLDGFYRAFSMIGGPCMLCRHTGCNVLSNESCRFPEKARPSMEGMGIDVFQTALNHSMPLKTLRTQEETRNLYCLILVD